METKQVGIREFRDNIASYIEAATPLAITRHGDTIGLYIPVRRKRTEAQLAAFDEAVAKWQAVMTEAGVTEDELMEDSKRLRRGDRG